MNLAERIETALLSLIRRELPDVDDGGLHQDHATKHWTLDPAWIVGDEIDLTLIAQTLADAVEVRVDPPEAA